MTTVTSAGHQGYFGDRHPVRLAAPGGTRFFTGTNQRVLACAYPLTPRCFASTPLKIVRSAAIDRQIADAAANFTNFQNLDAYQDDTGAWHMALAIGVNNAQRPFQWTVIVHASPVGPTSLDAVPTSWVADKVLVGSFATPVDANYSPKYFSDAGQLFQIYVRRRPGSDPRRNDIVAQPMTSPTERAAAVPVTLLRPGDGEQSFASELFDVIVDENDFRLVEVANVTRVNGKFALAYSAGKFNEDNYKSGVAWSDTFLPVAGGTYRKVRETDISSVWGTPGRKEVRYLPLRVPIPASATVATASDTEFAGWMTPSTR